MLLTRRLVPHILSKNIPIQSLSTAFMVQTRRAAQLVTKGEPNPKPVDIKPPALKAEQTSRPFKRAKKEHRPPSEINHVITEPEQVASPTKRPAKVRRKREQAVPKPSDFAHRVSSPWKVGAHVSAAGGVENSVVNAARVRANAFALFVKSQRKWSSPPLLDQNVASFKTRMKEFGYDPKHVLPHGSYLINLANPDESKREKSYECFLDDLRRCEQLGLMLYNFHPGSTVGNATKEESIAHIAGCINRAHKETSSVIIVIENMSGAKSIIGSQFTELRDIIEQVEDKSRVGVCLDTCHMYAAGYDISTKTGWDETMTMFDEQVGLSYLRGMHLNDSKTPLGSKKDRHENIGLGTIKLSAFLTIISDPRVQDIPLVLETPTFEAMEVWECEINVLNKLSEVGLGSTASVGDEGDPGRGELLKDMMGEIQSVIREHCGDKVKEGKKNRPSKSASKSTSSKRKKMGEDEEDELTQSDEAEG